MDEDYRESISLAYKWQYKTIDGQKFFGKEDGAGEWERRADYPVRYFLWKINREAWGRFDYWRFSEDQILAAMPIVSLELEQVKQELSEVDDVDDDEAPGITRHETSSLKPPSLLKARTLELDADSDLLEVVDDEWLADLGEQIGLDLTWALLMDLQALSCVQSGVAFLAGNDIAMAGAAAIKAREWLLDMNFEVGYAVSADDQKRNLAIKGADAAHAENRRLKRMAIELYQARSWPSYMQAARAISAQVHRAEMVVLKWINEHRRTLKG